MELVCQLYFPFDCAKQVLNTNEITFVSIKIETRFTFDRSEGRDTRQLGISIFTFTWNELYN